MPFFRAMMLGAGLALAGAGAASAQIPAVPPDSHPLPPGLTQQNGTIMMAPIYDDGSPPEPVEGFEYKPSKIPELSASDHQLYTRALDATRRGDWIAARGLAAQGHNDAARKLIEWRYLLDKNSGATFSEIDDFLKANPDWPGQDTLFARAEKAMPGTMAPTAVLFWFGKREPQTGIGKVRMGEAMMAAGRADEGRDMIRGAWIENSFDPDDEAALIQKHGDLFTPDVDRQRLSRLLWNGDIESARREMARVTPTQQQLAETRLNLIVNPPSGEKMLAGLPPALQDDPGLIFDRARLLRLQGNDDAEPALLLKAPTRELAKVNPDRWWGELNAAARTSLENANFNTAYALVEDTGLTGGQDFAEAQFMAGWIALRFLKDPKDALPHFQALGSGTTRPISQARAHYWSGRSYEAMGDLGGAWREYRLAAQNPATFYGQLAQARIQSAPKLHLDAAQVNAASARGDYDRDDLAAAIHVLADLGEEKLMRNFAQAYVDHHPDPKYVELLASDLVHMGFREVALRAAKEAGYNNILLLDYSHPLIDVPAYKGPGHAPEAALVLGLIRQETEFDTQAVSAAGAKGLMQLMPASARRAAAAAHLPFRANALLSDTTYNMQLGMTELSSNLAGWSGSYILAIAAYNAGPGNVRKWIDTYGDPRDPGVDPIDWIEEIPFEETRNYVMRVIENTEVYRNRLAGQDAPLQIMADLYRPNTPKLAVLPYAPPAPAIPTPEPKPTSAAGPREEVATRVPDPKPPVTPGVLPTIKPEVH
jgi:soluble lytic murein transglycosylase